MARKSTTIFALFVGLTAAILTGCHSMYGIDDPGAPSQWPWEAVSPESQGIRSADIDRMVDHIEGSDLDVHSVIIYRDGTVPVELYFDPFEATTTHNMKSTSKGVISTLVGIALHEGFIESLDDSVLSYMPEYDDGDPGKDDITIRDLLTMSAGLKWDENNLNSMYTFFVSKRIAKRVLDQPLEDTPGTTFTYNTGLTHLLSVVISRASGMSTMEFAEAYLFGPLEIENVQWDTDRDGVHIGGSELFLTPRDMMKLGVLYLNGGVYDGMQVVPASWVEMATSTQITGSFHGASIEYGYLWWLGIGNPLFTYLDEDDAFMAMGVRGQRILVLPESDTVVLVTADQHDASQIDLLIRDYIRPAL
jgi:CubicO group peptidase (beta-lactamase class C family)